MEEPCEQINYDLLLHILPHLGSIDELVGEAFGDGLNVPESRLPGSSAEQPDGLRVITMSEHITILCNKGLLTDSKLISEGMWIDINGSQIM